MTNFRDLIEAYEQGLNGPAIRHIVLNYSETETGLRNRQGPVGSVNRDQGIFDAYAGRQRLLLGTEGAAVLLARWAAIVADEIALKAPHVSALTFLGRQFGEKVFGGQPVLACRPGTVDLSQYSVSDPSGQVPIPMNTLFETATVFDTPATYGLQSTQSELFGLADDALEGIL